MSRLDIQRLSEVLGPLASNASGNDWFDAAELSRLLDAVGQHGKRGIRIRPSQSLDSLAFETDPVPWSNVGRFMRDGNLRPGSLLQFMAGDYAIQDAASLLPISLMQLQPGQRVLDCCAAPGGKSAAILEQLAGQGGLVSNEVIASRVDTLQLTLARTGYANYVITHQSVDHLAESLSDHDEELFDCVLVDAPCTGQSLVARGKQSLSAFSEHQIAHSAARQQSILRAAVRLVRPVVDWFIRLAPLRMKRTKPSSSGSCKSSPVGNLSNQHHSNLGKYRAIRVAIACGRIAIIAQADLQRP